MEPEINLLKLLLEEIKSGKLEIPISENLSILEGIITEFCEYSNKRGLLLQEKTFLMNNYIELVKEIKSSEKRLQYYQRMLDIDQNTKSFVYSQVAKYFYKRNDKESTLNYLNQAFKLLEIKEDIVIPKEDLIEMAYMFIDYDEIEKGLDCVFYANRLERERSKNIISETFETLLKKK